MRQLFQLISVHYKEFFREPGIVFWAVLFPILMAWGLGIAFTEKKDLGKYIAIVGNVENHDLKAFISDAKKQKKGNDEYLAKTIKNDKLGNVTYYFQKVNWTEAVALMKKGKANIIIQNTEDSIYYHFDPMNPDAQLTYSQLSSALEKNEVPETKATIKPMKETGSRYIDFLIPGLLAMGIMMSSMWGISYSLIDKRSKKLLRRMVATPMKKANFLISHFIARLTLSFFESVLLVAFAWVYFDIDISGSIPALFAVFVAGNIMFTGLAILVSSRTSKPEIGNGMINAVVMPMMITSGIFFSYYNFPDVVIPLIQLLPLTMVADCTRSIFNEGAGFNEVIVRTCILTGLGIGFFFAGLRIYKWY